MSTEHILIVGEMGVGKTTVGRLLAAQLGMPFLDSDLLIESTLGETAAAIADRDGVARLHELELETFLNMCGAGDTAVIAPAASVVDHEEGRRALEQHFTVWLTAPDDVLARRQGGHRRAVGVDERGRLAERRAPFWQRLANVTTGQSTPEAVAEHIILSMQMDGDI